ncbi:MAG TPA: TRAP transporter large permease subunit [Steroidobacteraceae bacterium]
MTGFVQRAENLLLAAALVLLVVLGVASASTQFVGADELNRHLTLLIGMVGGMVAAREGRLLAMGTVVQALPASWRPWVGLFSGAVATTVAALLTLAAWQFVRGEAAVAGTLAFGVPRIALQAVMPAGFAVITWRLARHASGAWPSRIAVLLIAVAAAWAVSGLDGGVAGVRLPLLVLLGAAILCGAPLFAGLAGIALVYFISAGDPIASIPLDHYDQVTNPLLSTLPLFTLAGFVVTATGAARRLVRLLQAWTGHLRGGPAVVTVFACAFFTAFTGGSGITILALGGLLMPILLHSRYQPDAALGLVTGAGSLGVLFAPCLPLILYSIVAQVTIEDMFLGGALPGLLMVVLACVWGVAITPRRSWRPRFSWRRVAVTSWRAKWELLLPVVPLVLIFGGFVLPVPAAALTAAYAIAVAAFVNRDLPKGEKRVEVVCECGLLVGGVLLILGTAMGLTNLLVTEHVPDRLAAWLDAAIDSRALFLLLLNLVMVVLGCVIEIFSAIIVVAPLVVPIAAAFDVHPVHLGVIMLASLELGYLMPPIGLNLLMSALRFDLPMLTVARATLPMLVVLAIGVALITAFPQMSLWLPQWFAARG